MSIFYDTTITTGISFVLFFGLLAYFGVHKFIGKALDDRADKIRNELDEAKRLREEAQEIFAEFERKQKAVEGQAEEIVAHAKAEAEAAAVKAKADLEVSIARRLRAADDQISQAEADAIKAVRNEAVTVAIAAASDVLAQRLGDGRAQGLVDAAIEDVSRRLH